MEKGKRIEAEFELPEGIIQHIQSFMNGKEAAQTTIFSKSWYAAWLTRPHLDLDQNHFLRGGDTEGSSNNNFWELVKEVIERYEKLNLKINSLRLCFFGSRDWETSSNALVSRLIVKALKLGVTDLDVKINHRLRGKLREFVLPYEVFGSENLIRLSVSGCGISIKESEKVRCSKLESLTLDKVIVEGNIIWDIILSCPLIEYLSIEVLDKIQKLSQFPVVGRLNVERDVDWPILMHQFHNLKRMSLYGVHFHPLYFDDFFSKFPCLKDLTLGHCYHLKLKVTKISSPTLEYINFTHNETLRVKFDVPNLRKITFYGASIPLLTFEAASSTWESDITISVWLDPPNAKWFLKLNKLLRILSPSKVSLSIRSQKKIREAKIQGLPKPEVENLTIYGPCSVCPALFYNLFQCCRPIYITHYWFPESFRKLRSNNFTEIVYERMMRQVSLNSCIAYQRMSGQCDLEEVSVEFYDESVSAWRPPLLDTSSSTQVDEQCIRLHLRWGR